MATIKDQLDALLKQAGLAEPDLPSIKRILATDDESELVRRLDALRTEAFKEYLEWATARRRFNSLSELDTARVLGLFLRVRRSAPSVGALVEDLSIPQGRATNMIGRIKYGEGRALAAMAFASAADEIERRLGEASETKKRKSITVSRDVIDRAEEVAFAIRSAPVSDHAKDGKFESPEELTKVTAGRFGATVTTSTRMWNYVLSELRILGEAT